MNTEITQQNNYIGERLKGPQAQMGLLEETEAFLYPNQ